MTCTQNDDVDIGTAAFNDGSVTIVLWVAGTQFGYGMKQIRHDFVSNRRKSDDEFIQVEIDANEVDSIYKTRFS